MKWDKLSKHEQDEVLKIKDHVKDKKLFPEDELITRIEYPFWWAGGFGKLAVVRGDEYWIGLVRCRDYTYIYRKMVSAKKDYDYIDIKIP